MNTDWIGPERQLPAPAKPDYRLLVQQLEELGHKIEDWLVRAWEAIKQAMQPLTDAVLRGLRVLCPLFGIEVPPRSKLRLYRHCTQHERREIVKLLLYPIGPRKISHKRAMIV